MAHEGFHEPYELLPSDVRETHRIIQSTIEELEAVDWYNQRAAVSEDAEAKAILEHNRDEEIEHACMGLEWLRRNNPVWDEMMQSFLFSEGPITEVEEAVTGDGTDPQPGDTAAAPASGLGIGKLE